MAGFIDEYLCSQAERTIFYRFQHTAVQTQSTPTTFAAALIFQLLGTTVTPMSLSLDATSQLHSFVSRYPQGPEGCNFDHIWKVAMTLLAMRSGYHLVIDALDECYFGGPDFPTPSIFVAKILQILEAAGMKAVIFSRPDPRFVSSSEGRLSVMDMTEDLVSSDILAFSAEEYHRLELPEVEKHRVLGHIRASSYGSFRWAGLFIEYLGRALNMTDFRARSTTTPPSVYYLYKTALYEATSTLTKHELACRRDIILTMFRAQRMLKVSELGDALSLRPEQTANIVHRLCKPLVNATGDVLHWSHPSVREFLDSDDAMGDPPLEIDLRESHGLLATCCLSILSAQRYQDVNIIGSYLRVGQDDSFQVPASDQPDDSGFYNYASRFWDQHLIRTEDLTENLAVQVGNFLASRAFVMWAQYSRADLGQFVGVVGVYLRLTSWHRQLDDNRKHLINLEGYVEEPYTQLARAFESTEGGDLMPWYARMSAGDIYSIIGFSDKEKTIREEVFAGLQGRLDPKDPLILRSRDHLAQTRLDQGKMRAARNIYAEVVGLGRTVLGTSDARFLMTLFYQGRSTYYMSDFEEAAVIFTTVSAQFLKTKGPESWQYLTGQLWLGYSAAQLGQLDLSLQLLLYVFQKRREQHGPEDTFSWVVQVGLAEVYALLGRMTEAIHNLEESLTMRRKHFPLSSFLRFDVELALVKAYHMVGRDVEVKPLLDQLESSVSPGSNYERFCQLTHLQGLVLAKNESIDEAIDLLQGILDQMELDQNNRALLWIRLDLATFLRLRGRGSDEDQASSNFDNIVKDISGEYEPSYPDEPNPPRLLAVAEQALRLVRVRQVSKARESLTKAQADWLRPSDLWLWVTANMDPDI